MTKNLSDEMQRNARQALAGLTPSRSGDEVGGLPLPRLVAAFFRSRYLVFGTTLFGLLIGTFMAITTSNNYVSTGMFSFSSSGAESRSVDPMQARETNRESIATGAAYILNSDDLLLRVVHRLTPQRILQPYQPSSDGQGGAKGLFFKIQRDWNSVEESSMTPEEALKRLQKTISVSRPQFTPVLIATCNATTPSSLARFCRRSWKKLSSGTSRSTTTKRPMRPRRLRHSKRSSIWLPRSERCATSWTAKLWCPTSI